MGRPLRLCLAVTFASLLTLPQLAWAETLQVTEQLTGPWQLFIDDELIASKTNVRRHYHAFANMPATH